jgi:HAD superfamily hydrolase (TIGR01458 family)
MSAKPIRTVLIDVSGTLHTGDKAVHGAIEAIASLRAANKKIRFLTNTTTKSSADLLKQLTKLGFDVQEGELITSVMATRQYLIKNKLRPYCLMEDTSDFEGGVNLDPPHNCVVLGLAPSKLDYESMNTAFRVLLRHPNLLAIHEAPYIRDTDGQLSLGPGAFSQGLEMAASCKAIVLGKPSKAFFESALFDGISANDTCIVGDDIFQDIQGGLEAGLGTAILVQTGKYQKGDEHKIENEPTLTCPSIVDAVNFILAAERAKQKKMQLGRKVAARTTLQK